MLDSQPREIIGVLPDSFRFLDRRVSLVVPYRFDRSKVFLGQFSYNGHRAAEAGRRRSIRRAPTSPADSDLAHALPAVPGGSVKMFEEARLAPRVRSLKDDLVGDVRTVLWVLMGTIGMVLLIACANVANLLLVRAESRQQELAIRAALGAGTGRIARELLLESVCSALLGGIVGLGLAFGALRLLVALAPATCRASRTSRSTCRCCCSRSCCRSSRAALRRDPGVQVRARAVGRHAPRRRTDREREPGTPSRAQHARRRAGRAGARAARQLRG